MTTWMLRKLRSSVVLIGFEFGWTWWANPDTTEDRRGRRGRRSGRVEGTHKDNHKMSPLRWIDRTLSEADERVVQCVSSVWGQQTKRASGKKSWRQEIAPNSRVTGGALLDCWSDVE